MKWHASLQTVSSKRGISPGDRVAMLLQNSPQAVALIYGTWLAGGVIVPLNPQARGHEVGALAEHAGARILVCEPDYRDLDVIAEQTEPMKQQPC